MRYFLLTIKIRVGEYEFDSMSLQRTRSKIYDADAYVRNFYGTCDERSSGDEAGTYYFHDGCLACWVSGLTEVTKSEYEVLKKFL